MKLQTLRSRGRASALLAGTVVGLLALSACGSSDDSSSDSKDVNVVGFSVLQTPLEKQFTDFQATSDGKDVKFIPSYGPSGDQSRAVEAGQPADYVHFSLEPDMQRLVDAKLVADDWNSGDTKGIVTDSVVAFVVRKGNPLHIKTWDDLVKPGVQVVTPNPASSGSAKWNLLAAYGQVIAAGGSDADAQAYVGKLLKNAAALPESAKVATTQFQAGTGDVLLSYENEAILNRQNGADFDYLVPDSTILIENPGAVTTKAPAQAKSFLDYLLSEDGQKTFASFGFRPVGGADISGVEVKGANDPANPFPTPKTLMTINDDFGGWDEANTKYFDEDNGIISKLLADSGKS